MLHIAVVNLIEFLKPWAAAPGRMRTFANRALRQRNGNPGGPTREVLVGCPPTWITPTLWPLPRA